MERILVIANAFYPQNNPRSFQTQGIVKGLCKNGYKVDLVLPKRDINLEMQIENLTIHYVETTINLKQMFGVLVRNSTGYGYYAAKYIKKHKLHEKSKVMLTISVPFACHLAGLRVKRANMNLKWLADYGDPHSFSPFKIKPNSFKQRLKSNFFKRKIDETIERIAVKHMDKIIIPFENSKEAYLKLDAKPEKINVIPQLFEQTIEECHYKHIGETKLNLLFAGVFLPSARSPKEFLIAYKNLIDEGKEIALHYFGRSAGEIDNYLREASITDKEKYSIYVNNSIPRPQMLNLMKKMDLLVNITHVYEELMPCKVLDYIHSGIKVLNIGNYLFDEFANVKNDRNEIYEALAKLSKADRIADYSKLAEKFDYDKNLEKLLALVRGH